MLTLLASMSLSLALPANLPERPDFVARRGELSMQRRIEMRLHVGHYVGILAADWITTQYGQPFGSIARGDNEMNPLPGMGSGFGRAVGMGAIALAWTGLDKWLVSHGHARAARALRTVLSLYGAVITSWNLGWQRSWSPDHLIPGQWRRDPQWTGARAWREMAEAMAKPGSGYGYVLTCHTISRAPGSPRAIEICR